MRHASNRPVRSMCGPGKSNDAPMAVPASASCASSTSVRVTTAPFVTEYSGVPMRGVIPPFGDDVLTTRPASPCSIMWGTNALIPWMTP